MRSTPRPTRRRSSALILGSILVLPACATTVTGGGNAEPAAPVTTSAPDSVESTTAASSSTTTESPTTTSTTTTTTVPPTTTTTTTVAPTTTSVTPIEAFNPDCVVRSDTAAALQDIAVSVDAALPVDALWIENDTNDAFDAGALIDICAGNAVDDITGDPRPPIDDDTIARARRANVERQQAKLNELFESFGSGPIAVDGASGPITGQRLCAARLALGFPTTVDDMNPGSAEQAALYAATSVPLPDSSAVTSARWVIIDRTCQMMFIGSGQTLTFVWPTSTGSEGFETRDQDQVEAFRFNPALDNGGWHDSTEFPSEFDNPLNGNLYKPLYFDLGQAIHGANNVPPTPQSKGCARLRVSDQDKFVAFLGLDQATEELWRKEEIDVNVTVQGEFVGRTATE